MHQNMSIRDGFQVRKKAEELGCDTDVNVGFVPVGLKNADSKSELSYHGSAITVNKLAQAEEIELDTFVDFEEFDTTQLKSTEIFLGGLFVTFDFLKNNYEEIITLIKIVHEHYSRVAIDGEAQMSVLVEEEDGSVTKLEYNGPVDEIDSILDKLDNMKDDD